MGWYFRDPRAFPRLFHNVLETAVSRSPEPVLLNQVANRREAQELTQEFSWFRWTVKHPKATIFSAAREAVLLYDFRSEVSRAATGQLLVFVRARPTFLSDFVNLNETLAAEFSSIVNEKIPSAEATNRG